MISVIQRVSRAAVTVKDPPHSAAIGAGLCVLLCAEQSDTETDADWMAGKLARLRIFRDEQDKMNRSVQDIHGEALVISQFTLAGETSKGNRPSFTGAAAPELGEKLYERVCDALQREHNVPVKRGVFGAMMSVEIINDGPVTLIVHSSSHDITA
jgi:D-tyrosyl-tRNA(Tyr) deacylase